MTKVILMRGLPGSGKSTYAQKLLDKLKSTEKGEYFSADRFWLVGGEYKFDPTRIGEAHAWCFQHYLSCIKECSYYPQLASKVSHTSLILVDNTNCHAYELAPYILAASAYGLECEIVTLWIDPLAALKRNIHQVPLATILTKYEALLSEKLPSFWKHTTLLAEGI